MCLFPKAPPVSVGLGGACNWSHHPKDLGDHFMKAIRGMGSGPGNWVSLGDVTNLKGAFHFPCSFMDPRWTSYAAKLRVIEYVAPDCPRRVRELEATQLRYAQRPFGAWHSKCLFQVLASVKGEMSDKEATRTIIMELELESDLPGAWI